MKKYLFILCLLFSTPVYAEDFISALGLQCAKIIYNHSKWEYPTNYKMENSNNKQFTYLEKCLFLYKDNGGNIETFNKKYEKAKNLEEVFYTRCIEKRLNNTQDPAKERETCLSIKRYIWESVMIGNECEYYDPSDAYYINNLLSHCVK